MKTSAILTFVSAAVAWATLHGVEQRESNWTVGQTVQTTSGPVNGHPATNASQVSEYLGIPFAQAPIGDLRFAAPQKYTGSDTHNGTVFVSI